MRVILSSLFSFAPVISPPQYSSHFCKYISSSINTISSEITRCDFKDLGLFTTSSCPSVDFFSRDKDGNGNSFINNRYVCTELERRRSEYQITLENIVLFFLNLSSLSSSRILNVCSPSNLI